MDRKALFVGIEAHAGLEAEVAQFLRETLGPVQEEPETRDWYAMRLAPREFAIFDTFPGSAARLNHILGEVGRSLIAKSFTVLDGMPEIHTADILAAKSPAGETPRECLHVPLLPRSGREEEVAQFLIQVQPLVDAEPGTLSWYALRVRGGTFAIIDFFADESGRDAHLAGKVVAALMERATELLAVPPDIHRGVVLASKTGGSSPPVNTPAAASA